MLNSSWHCYQLSDCWIHSSRYWLALDLTPRLPLAMLRQHCKQQHRGFTVCRWGNHAIFSFENFCLRDIFIKSRCVHLERSHFVLMIAVSRGLHFSLSAWHTESALNKCQISTVVSGYKQCDCRDCPEISYFFCIVAKTRTLSVSVVEYCQYGLFEIQIATPASLWYPLSVFNKNSNIR